MAKIFNKKSIIAIFIAVLTLFTCTFIGCKTDETEVHTHFNITGFEENGVISSDLYTYIVFKTDLSSEKVLDSVWVKINSFGEQNVDGKVYVHVGAVDSLSVTVSEGFLGLPTTSAKTKGTPIDAVAENKGWQCVAITQGRETTSSGAYIVGSKQYVIVSVLGQVDIEELVMVYFDKDFPNDPEGLATLTVEAVGATKSVVKVNNSSQNMLIKPVTEGSRMPFADLIPEAQGLLDNQSLFDINNINQEATNKYTYINN